MTDATRTTMPLPPAAAPAAARAVVVAGAAAALAALVIQRWLALDPSFLWTVLVLTPLGGGALVLLATTRAGSARFGRANAVTLARGALTLLLLGLAAAVPDAAVAWLAVGLALVGLGLDGVDGWLARRHGEMSAFGARFDMETDAVLIVALAVLCWQQAKAGPWIVLAGALRYLFVAASAVAPWLDRPLPPSRRRQTVCVLQIVSLILCLVPAVRAPISGSIAGAGLALLVASFAIDVRWLARHAAASRR